MIIDTNGFEIGNKVYLAEKKLFGLYRPKEDYIVGFKVEMLHNKPNVCAILERSESYVCHVTRLYNTEEEIIRYCDELNSKM